MSRGMMEMQVNNRLTGHLIVVDGEILTASVNAFGVITFRKGDTDVFSVTRDAFSDGRYGDNETDGMTFKDKEGNTRMVQFFQNRSSKVWTEIAHELYEWD